MEYGNVEVLITYAETSKIVPIYDENSSESVTNEVDSSGGTRSIVSTETSKEVVSDSDSNPVTEKIVMPTIEGAIITAEGASNSSVKNNITSAVQAATGLAVHKIQVFEMGD